MSFSMDIFSTHEHLVQCSLRAAVDGMFLLSVSACSQMALRIMPNHFSCFSTELLAVTEWYKVTGDVNLNADACAPK